MKVKIKPLSWQITPEGFIPYYQFKGLKIAGPERPFPQFLKGERHTVAQWFMCQICTALFGDAPLVFLDDEDLCSQPHNNPEWDTLPFMVAKDDAPYGWVMNNGDIDVLGMFNKSVGTVPADIASEPD